MCDLENIDMNGAVFYTACTTSVQLSSDGKAFVGRNDTQAIRLRMRMWLVRRENTKGPDAMENNRYANAHRERLLQFHRIEILRYAHQIMRS